MEISVGTFKKDNVEYQIEVRKYDNGIINYEITNYYDNNVVLGFDFDFNTIPYQNMNVRNIKNTIVKKFISM